MTAYFMEISYLTDELVKTRTAIAKADYEIQTAYGVGANLFSGLIALNYATSKLYFAFYKDFEVEITDALDNEGLTYTQTTTMPSALEALNDDSGWELFEPFRWDGFELQTLVRVRKFDPNVWTVDTAGTIFVEK